MPLGETAVASSSPKVIRNEFTCYPWNGKFLVAKESVGIKFKSNYHRDEERYTRVTVDSYDVLSPTSMLNLGFCAKQPTTCRDSDGRITEINLCK